MLTFDLNIIPNLPEQWLQLDYNTSNALIGLGTIGIIILLYILALILIALFKLFLVLTFKKFGGKQIYKYIHRKLFFNFIIDLGLEAYMELLIFGYISLFSKLSLLSGDFIGLVVGFFSFCQTIIFLPFSLIKIIFFTYKGKLHLSFFKDRWGSLYEGIKYKSKFDLSYNLVYIIRRLAYICLGMFIKDYR